MKLAKNTFFITIITSFCSASFGMQLRPVLPPERIHIGEFFYTLHALKRMEERDIDNGEVSATIRFGEQFCCKKDKVLCIDRGNELAIYYNPQKNIVISAMREATASWIYNHLKESDRQITRNHTQSKKITIDRTIPLHKLKGCSASKLLNFSAELFDY